MVTIADVLNQWESIGVFDYMLPFLLIFAFVFGVLSSTNVFSGKKNVNIIISLVIGLMALRLGYVQVFFTELFPRFGIAIAAFIVIIMLAAMFIPEKQQKPWFIGFAVFGLVAGLIVVINTFNQFDWFGSMWLEDNWITVVGFVMFIILIILVVIGKGSSNPDNSAKLVKLRVDE